MVIRTGCVSLLLAAACGHAQATPAAPPPVVEVAPVEQRDVPIYREWVATLDGFVNAKIQARVPGYLVQQHSREGSVVSKNEVLFEIDARPLVVTLEQARAELAARIADADRSAHDVDRDRPLAEAHAIPQSQFENDVENHRAAVATVDAARAAVRQAELDVGFAHVRSLIDGVVGITEVQIGNLVSATSVLTTVSQIQPIKAWFAISEREYLDIADRLENVVLANGVRADGDGGNVVKTDDLAFELTLVNGERYPFRGTFLFANRQIDSLTGTIRIATSFPNPRRVLRPGEFGRIRAVTSIHRGALLVPLRAVSELQGLYQVMVLAPDHTVRAQTVVLGPQVDSLRVVESSVERGQLVIVEGAQKVRPGIKVSAKPYVRSTARGG